MKTPQQLAAQREMDREIAHYVREMQATAPISPESVHAYLTGMRRRTATLAEVQDRLDHLVDGGYLRAQQEWIPGSGNEWRYTCTSAGRQALDGETPWTL